jgi:hypothetical protein
MHLLHMETEHPGTEDATIKTIAGRGHPHVIWREHLPRRGTRLLLASPRISYHSGKLAAYTTKSKVKELKKEKIFQ